MTKTAEELRRIANDRYGPWEMEAPEREALRQAAAELDRLRAALEDIQECSETYRGREAEFLHDDLVEIRGIATKALEHPQ